MIVSCVCDDGCRDVILVQWFLFSFLRCDDDITERLEIG